MRSQITTYFHIVVLATCFSVLITKVSSIYCVQCSSDDDLYCQLARMHVPEQCPETHQFCVTTVVFGKTNDGESRVTRGCSDTEASGCRRKRGSYICKIPCQQDGCNANENFITDGLPFAATYGNALYRGH